MNPLSQPSPSRTPLELRLLALLFGKEYRAESLDAIRILASKEIEAPSPPPIDAHVACADVSEPAQTNGNHAENASPEGSSQMDDHGRGGFSPDIEAEWLRYIKFQSDRLRAAGEKSPYVALYSHGTAAAGSYDDRHNITSKSIEDAVNRRIAFLQDADAIKSARMAKLEAELAELKGERQAS